jgi:hypothetical protein
MTKSGQSFGELWGNSSLDAMAEGWGPSSRDFGFQGGGHDNSVYLEIKEHMIRSGSIQTPY